MTSTGLLASNNAPAGAAQARGRTLGVLIDFDNFASPRRDLNPSAVRHGLLECLQIVLGFHGQSNDIRVRLYGGWMAEGLLSRRGSEVAAILPSIDPFPIVLDGSVIRGSVTLATSLIDDPTVFSDTFRKRGSIPRVRLAGSPLPEGCVEDKASCPAKILKQFTQSVNRLCPASACGLTAEAAFVAHEQKMVDTLMSCDLLEIVADQEYAGVSIVSADTDFVPPLLQAARRTDATLQLVTPLRGWSPSSAAILAARQVNVTEMEPIDGR